jgi:hypothetical protein
MGSTITGSASTGNISELDVGQSEAKFMISNQVDITDSYLFEELKCLTYQSDSEEEEDEIDILTGRRKNKKESCRVPGCKLIRQGIESVRRRLINNH